MILGIYLAALGFGGVLILVSLLLGGGDDSDAETDTDKDVDKGALTGVLEGVAEKAGFDKGGLPKADFDKNFDKATHTGGDAFWSTILSLRFWTFGAMTFGLTGTLLTLLSVGEPVAGIVAAVTGLVLGVAAARFFRQLNRDNVTASTDLGRFAGEEGRVVITVRPGGTGKIAIETHAGRVELMATTRDVRAIEIGRKVIIAGVTGGVADVSRLSDDPTDEASRAAAAARRQTE